MNLPKVPAIVQMSIPRVLHAKWLDCVFVPRHAIAHVFLDLDLHAMCVVVRLVGCPLGVFQ
jgi:hypothetical protein